ncbi:MAG TPA: hypothetical protein VNH46_10510, partial [Gemmatimonadales bacterium]|nr:hypothetical protein [Gemmatimonadales bacterium]
MTPTNSATPSISAAEMIMAVWIRALFSGSLAADTADADAGAEHREAAGQAGADESESLAGGLGHRRFLQQGEQVQHVVLHGKWERCRSSSLPGFRPGLPPGPSPVARRRTGTVQRASSAARRT